MCGQQAVAVLVERFPPTGAVNQTRRLFLQKKRRNL
jgi:hypothetical protein